MTHWVMSVAMTALTILSLGQGV
ncbi:MAG: hypothetical protein K0R41_3156, partial [Geminicoccaceae bacterium]|nr:hypothetical protein [Geminicoccaceae bacterium]